MLYKLVENVLCPYQQQSLYLNRVAVVEGCGWRVGVATPSLVRGRGGVRSNVGLWGRCGSVVRAWVQVVVRESVLAAHGACDVVELL